MDDLPTSTQRRAAGPEDAATCPRCNGMPYVKQHGLSHICGLCGGCGKVPEAIAAHALLIEDEDRLDFLRLRRVLRPRWMTR